MHRKQSDPPFPQRKKDRGRRHKERNRLHPKGSQQLSATLLSGIMSFSPGPRFDGNQRSSGPAVSAALREDSAMQCGGKLSAGPCNGTHHRCVPFLKPAPCLTLLPVLPVCSPGLFSRCRSCDPLAPRISWIPWTPGSPGFRALAPVAPFPDCPVSGCPALFRLSRLFGLIRLCSCPGVQLCPCRGHARLPRPRAQDRPD